MIDCGKSAHRHNLTQDEINAVIIERARAGKRVVRLKGGDPFVFGRGGEEWLACVAAGVSVSVVPGLSSALAGPASAGIPLTHRGVASDFTVVSGHLDPGRAAGHGVDWPGLASGGGHARAAHVDGPARSHRGRADQARPPGDDAVGGGAPSNTAGRAHRARAAARHSPQRSPMPVSGRPR